MSRPALLLLVLAVESSLAVHFKTYCQVGRELRKHNVNKKDLSNWACLILASSSGNTAAVVNNNDGSKGYGLFQINSRYWCGTKSPGGGCGVKCSSLADDDISDDVQCAKRIKGSQGWSAWDGWTRRCKGQKLPDVRNC